MIRTSGKLATGRVAELQERVLVVERRLRDVRDQLTESVGQTTETASGGRRSAVSTCFGRR